MDIQVDTMLICLICILFNHISDILLFLDVVVLWIFVTFLDVASHRCHLSHFFPLSLLPDMVGGLAASSAMLSPVVQTVLQMGFEASLVESLVQTKYLLTGQQYTSVSDLVSDVLQAEQEDGQRGPQSRGNQCGN